MKINTIVTPEISLSIACLLVRTRDVFSFCLQRVKTST